MYPFLVSTPTSVVLVNRPFSSSLVMMKASNRPVWEVPSRWLYHHPFTRHNLLRNPNDDGPLELTKMISSVRDQLFSAQWAQWLQASTHRVSWIHLHPLPSLGALFAHPSPHYPTPPWWRPGRVEQRIFIFFSGWHTDCLSCDGTVPSRPAHLRYWEEELQESEYWMG